VLWADFGLERVCSGQVVGFNVCRDRQVGTPQWTQWARTNANFHDPVRFAHIVLSPSEGFLSSMEPELRKGERLGPVEVFTPEGYYGTSTVTYRQLADTAMAGLRRSLNDLRVVGATDSSAAFQRQLTVLRRTYRDRLRPLEEISTASRPLDAATWYRMKLQVDTLSAELMGVVWEARLRAWLSQI